MKVAGNASSALGAPVLACPGCARAHLRTRPKPCGSHPDRDVRPPYFPTQPPRRCGIGSLNRTAFSAVSLRFRRTHLCGHDGRVTNARSPHPSPGRPDRPDRANHPGRPSRSLDREILALAIPSLGALIAEPILVLVDTAMVGHLGTAQLAGLTLAATVLTTIVGLCVFLAYATTALTSRRAGAGDEVGAMRAGVDGLWLALGLGVLGAVALLLTGEPILHALGADAATLPHALAYLHTSAFGLPGMLLVLAATGALRGALDTRTPLRVAVAGALVNIPLNAILIYGLGLGVAGSGLGTAIAQTGMGAALTATVVRRALAAGATLRPRRAGIGEAILGGLPLLVRTASLRAALLLTASTAATLGTVPLAGHQAVMSLWNLAAFGLDALAIAAQALVGRALGAAQIERVRGILRRCRRWGIGAGAALGVLFVGLAFLVGPAFSADPQVHDAIRVGLVVAALCLPLAGVVYVGDGVLIGAGDGRYLAIAGVVVLAAYVPAAWATGQWAPGGAAGLAWLWASYGIVYMGARAVSLEGRMAGSRWLRTGA